MKKSKLKEVMKMYNIVESELDDVFSFVADLLYLRQREVEQNEPYAVRTINTLYEARNEVDDLLNYVSELEDDTEQDFSMIHQVTKEVIANILNQQTGTEKYGAPYELLWYYDEDAQKYIGCDNVYAQAWIEEFDTKEECINWLLDINNEEED